MSAKEMIDGNLFDRFYDVIVGLIDKSDARRAIEFVSVNQETQEKLLGQNAEESRFGTLILTTKRLRLVSNLQRLSVAHLLHSEQYGLVSYLLLTCFDILGQKNEWVDFNEWLSSGRKQVERDETSTALRHLTDPIEIAREIFLCYNSRYSVRTSFLNFIDNVLPAEVRKELIDSIRIHKNGQPNIDAFDKEKCDFLFAIRNSYTHSAKAFPGLSTLLQDRYPLNNCVWRTTPGLFGSFWNISLRNHLPIVLEKTVKLGLIRYIQNILAEIPTH